MRYSKQEEEQAYKEYQTLLDTLEKNFDSSLGWSGKWEDHVDSSGKKVKGDKHGFMREWLKTKDIVNDSKWNIIDEDDYI